MAKEKLWNEESYKSLEEWWEWLKEERGECAKLRRCQNELEVCFQPAYIRLCQRLPKFNKEKLAIIAGLLAHVKSISKQKIAEQMSANNDNKPNLSEARFRRLIACETTKDLYPQLRRAFSLLGKQINIRDLAESLYFWNERTRKHWVYDYYAHIKINDKIK